MESRSLISQYFVQQSAPMQEEEEDTEAVWVRREAARMRQIAIGKARPEYRRYVSEVPVNLREPVHPSTPNPKDRVSKRQFDRALGEWRRRLHEFDAELGFDDTRPSSSEGPVQPGAMIRSPTQTPSLFGGEVSLPRHAVPPPKSPPQPQTESGAMNRTPAAASPSLVPVHPPPSQPPMMDGGVVQLHLADQLPAPPQAQGPPMQAHPEPPHVDLASAAAIGVAAAMTAIFRGQHCGPCGACAPPPSWNCEMPCDPMMYVPHMEEQTSGAWGQAVPMMCDAASSSFMQPMMNVAPETPMRGRQMPMDDGETPPPVCPFWTQANSENNFVPFQKAVLGAVTEECERGTKLTYEDALSPCAGNRGHLSIPKEAMEPMTPPRETRRAACSPSSVIQTPKPGWVVETPSPNSWLSRDFVGSRDFAPYPSW